MKRTTKKVVIALTIIAIILIIIITGVILYLKTDMFKSNKDLFYKYALENISEVSKYVEKDENLNTIKQGKSVTTGTMTFDMTTNNSEVANETVPARNFNVVYEKKSDPTTNRDSAKVSLKYLNSEIINIDYLRNDDRYAIKSDEVVNKYLTFSNGNLKQLAQKYGISNTEYIPDKIEFKNIEEILKVDESDINYIIQNYSDIISNQISNDSYYKNKKNITSLNNKTVEATCYGVKLSSKTIANIEEQFLNKMIQDDILLGKILEKITLIYPEANITAKDLKEEIRNLIYNIQNAQETQETMEVVFYHVKGEIVKTTIKIQNEDKIKVYTIDYQTVENSGRMLISYEDNINEDEAQEINLKSIEVAKQVQGTQTNKVIVLTFKTKEDKEYKISIQNKQNEDMSSQEITNDKIFIVNIADETSLVAKINSVIKSDNNVSIEELTEQNSAVINEFSPEYMINLITAISRRVQTIYNKKIEEITSSQSQQTIIDTTSNQEQNSTEQGSGGQNNTIGNNIYENGIIQNGSNVII